MSKLRDAMLEQLLGKQIDMFDRHLSLLDKILSKDDEEDEKKKILSRIEGRLNKSAEQQIQLYPS